MNYDVIVIGAGASGLVAAITATRNGRRVLVIEQKDKAGKKILATGNGKCNFTNLHQSPDCYRSNDSAFPMKVLSCFDVQNTIEFFRDLGIFPKERNGYLYPNSEQATSIVQVLIMECQRLKVSVIYGEKVIQIKKPDFTVITEQGNYSGHHLILAAGGCASPKLGSDGSGFRLAEQFGHTLIKPLPALVQLKSTDKYCKTISGVRTIARVTAYGNHNIIACEEGELLFADYGISGIPILQISRYVAKALDKKVKVTLIIDFLPSIKKEEVESMIVQRIGQNPDKNLEEMMVGLFNHKLNYILLKESGLDPLELCGKLKLKELGKYVNHLVKQIKEFHMNITGTNSFDQAQVCAGGISTKEIDPDTMESRLVKNLYFAGEIVDVDGTCGGYNLQWAWSSGYLAGKSTTKN